MTLLAIGSVLALAALVVHSARFLPRRRAAAFWVAAALYGIARGVGVRFVTERLLGARAPYVMHGDGPALGSVPVQEIAGWAIVAYLGWWLGWRFSRSREGASPAASDRDARRAGTAPPGPRLFPQILWACLFLGAVGWAIETAAGAAGWWRWTLPGSPLLLGVPATGILDWSFAGIDFLLPFLVITSSGLAGRPARWLALGAFPLHFLAHATVGSSDGSFRTLVLFTVHAGLYLAVLWLALASSARDVSFAERPTAAGRRPRSAPAGTWALPLLALVLVLGVPAALETFVLGRPSLLISLVPAVLVAAGSLAPPFALAGAAAAAVLALGAPSLLFAVVPGATAMLVRWVTPDRRAARAVVVLALAVLAAALHLESVRGERDLRRRLDEALIARDRGDLATAESSLQRISRDYPSSHAPKLLLGEIAFHRGDLRESRDAFEAALVIKPDAVLARRYLAALALRRGDSSEAAAQCARGLETAPDDVDLKHLAEIAR